MRSIIVRIPTVSYENVICTVPDEVEMMREGGEVYLRDAGERTWTHAPLALKDGLISVRTREDGEELSR